MHNLPSAPSPGSAQAIVDAYGNFGRVHPFIEKLIAYANLSRCFHEISIPKVINSD
jgi:hypothetical protein